MITSTTVYSYRSYVVSFGLYTYHLFIQYFLTARKWNKPYLLFIIIGLNSVHKPFSQAGMREEKVSFELSFFIGPG